MSLIEKVFHYLGKNFPEAVVVQIGAMDGITFDDARWALDLYKWKALLVEPIPYLFEELKENFKDRENYIFEQAAVSNRNGTVKMFTIPVNLLFEEENQLGFKGMSTLYPLKNGYKNNLEVRNKYGKDIDVPSLTFETLLFKHNISSVDILLCDAEGHDFDILDQVDLDYYKPKFIRLEYINLTEEEKVKAVSKLEDKGYVLEIGDNIDAVSPEIWEKMEEEDRSNPISLIDLMSKYGTDKGLSGYAKSYEPLFKPIKDNTSSVLEIGIGTLDPKYPSTFVRAPRHFPHYRPGGSLRVWRDYFPEAQIYGVDIADDCMFSEDRITTFLFDSSDKEKCTEHLSNLEFDIIIDDGNHDPKYQIATLENLFGRVKEEGYYIIEDVGGYGGKEQLLVEYLDRFVDVVDSYSVSNKGNHIIIKKVLKKKTQIRSEKKNYTIVSGLWNISREGREFEEHYIPRFKEFLKIPVNMVLFIPKELHEMVWEVRDSSNTFVKEYELSEIKNIYHPFWTITQRIRTAPEWYNQTGEGGWLKNSPQCKNEWYNPIVQSKMFMLHDASIWNPFDTDYFFWLDAGITNTVPASHLINDGALDKITNFANPFLFLSYPYDAVDEIHGFNYKKMNELAGEPVKYVCRGGLFGGHKDQLHEANGTYYSMLQKTLNSNLMGTEESVFTLMAYNEPEIYRRYMLDGNGLIVKFTEALIKNTVVLEEPTRKAIKQSAKFTDKDVEKYKTNLYVLTFNFPEQLLHTISSMEKIPEWLEKPHLVLLDNSTEKDAKSQNKEIAEKYNFEYVDLGSNRGICGGRMAAAEHFDKSDADFMFFFEDDMTVNSSEEEGQFCRNGFRKYIPNLYNIVHKVMLKERFDFLKLSFTEVFMDNNIQVSWYNVPQVIRDRDWPDYNKLPVTGLDPNAPRTHFDRIDNVDGVSYITGDIYYANWPMIVSKEGNKRMFLDTTWAYPFEQTWMSHMYQLTREGKLNPAVLLAAPILHDRIKHYKPEERREN